MEVKYQNLELPFDLDSESLMTKEPAVDIQTVLNRDAQNG
jgi:hypothetical protein